MKNALYGIRDCCSTTPSREVASYELLFKGGTEEYDEWRFRGDMKMSKFREMASYMLFSTTYSLEDMDELLIGPPIYCAGCLYSLYFVSRPLFSAKGEDRLFAFTIFACIEGEMVGVLNGYHAMSDDIVEFYKSISDKLNHTVCSRSWRYIAERTFPDLHRICDLADKTIPPALQDEILNYIRNMVSNQLDTESIPLVLVSDIYIEEEMRGRGVLTHMLAALDAHFSDKYLGLFYLAPRRDTEVIRSLNIPLFESYDASEYDLGLNVELAKKFHMDIIGDERPLGMMNSLKVDAA